MELSDEKHIGNINKLYELWKKTQCLRTVLEHECPSASCTITNVVGYINKRGKVHILDAETDLNNVVFKYNHLYICQLNGEPHWCGDRCDHRERDEYGYVCKLSGRRSESAISDTWVPQYRISATSQESKDPKALGEHDVNGDVVRTVKHVDYATNIVFNLLFSRTRMFAEQRKYADQKIESEKAVSKYIKSQTTNGEPICYTTMLEIYIHTMRARRIFFALVPKCSNADKLSLIYAKKICSFWRVITQKTPFGQLSPNTFSFVNFVCPALYMMRMGLVISNIPVIRRCQLLSTLLPEANTLDAYSVNKHMFTQTKNNILKALRDAVDEYKISPHELITY